MRPCVSQSEGTMPSLGLYHDMRGRMAVVVSLMKESRMFLLVATLHVRHSVSKLSVERSRRGFPCAVRRASMLPAGVPCALMQVCNGQRHRITKSLDGTSGALLARRAWLVRYDAADCHAVETTLRPACKRSVCMRTQRVQAHPATDGAHVQPLVQELGGTSAQEAHQWVMGRNSGILGAM